MESADLPGMITDSVAVHRAEGVLATMLDVSIALARVDLEIRAQLADSSLVDAAQRVLADHARRIRVTTPRPTDEEVLAALRRHLSR